MKFGNPGASNAVPTNVNIVSPVPLPVTDGGTPVNVNIQGPSPLPVTIPTPVPVTIPVPVQVVNNPGQLLYTENRQDDVQPVAITNGQVPNVPVYNYSVSNLNGTGGNLYGSVNATQDQWTILYEMIIGIPPKWLAAGAIDVSVALAAPNGTSANTNIFSIDIDPSQVDPFVVDLKWDYGMLLFAPANIGYSLGSMAITASAIAAGKFVRVRTRRSFFASVAPGAPPNLPLGR